MEAELGLEITQLLIVVLGIITSLVMGALKLLNTGIAKLPKTAKLMLVGAIAIPITLLGGWLGIDLPADPTTWDGVTVNVILTYLSAMGARAATRAVVPKVE